MLEWKSIYSDDIRRSNLLLYLPREKKKIVLEKRQRTSKKTKLMQLSAIPQGWVAIMENKRNARSRFSSQVLLASSKCHWSLQTGAGMSVDPPAGLKTGPSNQLITRLSRTDHPRAAFWVMPIVIFREKGGEGKGADSGKRNSKCI